MTMTLARALEILDWQMQADVGVGIASCYPYTKKQVEAAQRVVDYHADKEYSSVAGRTHRAKSKNKS